MAQGLHHLYMTPAAQLQCLITSPAHIVATMLISLSFLRRTLFFWNSYLIACLLTAHLCNTLGQFELVGGNRRWGTRCTYDFYSQPELKTGRFFSPAYPQNYRANTRCLYVFYGQRRERVRVHFSRIELEFFDGRYVCYYLLGSPTLVGRLKLYCSVVSFFFTGPQLSAAAARPPIKCIPEVRL